MLHCEPLQHDAYAICKEKCLLYTESHNTALGLDVQFAFLVRSRDSERVLHKVYIFRGLSLCDMFTA